MSNHRIEVDFLTKIKLSKTEYDSEGKPIYPEYSKKEFCKLAKCDLSHLPDMCPVKTCGCELSVVWDGECFILFCTYCTWEPEDGFDQPVRWIPVTVVEKMNPIFGATYLTQACANGQLPGRRFKVNQHSEWHLPVHTVRKMTHKPTFEELYYKVGFAYG